MSIFNKTSLCFAVLLSQLLSCLFSVEFRIVLTTHSDKFCTWKNPTILLFNTDNPYFFTTFSKFVSLPFPYFFVEGHLNA